MVGAFLKKLSLGIVVLALLIIFLSSAYANLDINVNPVMTSVYRNGSISYNLIVTNKYSRPVDVSISFPDVNWVGYTDPLNDYRFTLQPREVKETKLLYYPSLDISDGPYLVKLSVRDNTHDEPYNFDLPAYLRPYYTNSMEFLPSLRFVIDSPYEIDPRKDFNVSIKVSNLNEKNIKNLKLIMKYSLGSSTQIINLEGKETKEAHFSFTMDNYTRPMNDVLYLYSEYFDEKSNETFTWNDQRSIKIISYSNIESKRIVNESFLKSFVRYNLHNDGNIGKKALVEEKISSFKGLFTKSSIDPVIIEKPDGKYYSWEVFLGPNGEKTFYYETNYMPIFVLFILITLSFLLYYLLRSTIVVRKDVVNLATREGGISKIKIIIHIKNRKNSSYDSIRIIEKLPKIVNIEENFDIGSLEPVNINRSFNSGTVVKWELSHIEGYEERIITYKIDSKLSILGGLSLPSTLIKFQDKRGREMVVKSNRVNLEI